jgi:hypothetical protein
MQPYITFAHTASTTSCPKSVAFPLGSGHHSWHGSKFLSAYLVTLLHLQVLALSTAFLSLSESPNTLGLTLTPPPPASGAAAAGGGSSSHGSSAGTRPPGIRFLWSIKDSAAKFLPEKLPQDKVSMCQPKGSEQRLQTAHRTC